MNSFQYSRNIVYKKLRPDDVKPGQLIHVKNIMTDDAFLYIKANVPKQPTFICLKTGNVWTPNGDSFGLSVIYLTELVHNGSTITLQVGE